MAALAQNIRSAKPDPTDVNNPEKLFSFVKPERTVFEDGAPTDDDGEDLWLWVDRSDGDVYKKVGGKWVYEYKYGSGGGGGGIDGAVSVGTGTAVYRRKTGATLEFASLDSPDASVEITDGDTLSLQARPDCVNFSGIGAARTVDPVLGKTIVLREFLSTDGKIALSTPDNNSLDFGVQNLTKDDVGLNYVDNISNGQGLITFAPTAGEDNTAGYAVGSIWVETGTESTLWVARSVATGAAVWEVLAETGSVPTSYVNDSVGACGTITSQLIPRTGAFVPLQITWASAVEQGNWALNANVGIGPHAIQRSLPASGSNTDLFKITVDVSLYNLNITGTDQTVQILLFDNIPLQPSQVVPCSGMYPTALAPISTQRRSNASVSFLYRSTRSSPFWYLGARLIAGTAIDALIYFESVNMTITQIA